MQEKTNTSEARGSCLQGSSLARFAEAASEWTGSSPAFGLAVLIIAAWMISGPVFHYSDTWQLVINTGTTIVTFLMVFLIQRAQNKDSRAVHLKLNELVAAVKGASNRLVNAEGMTEEELKNLHEQFSRLAELAAERDELRESHSVEEAAERIKEKLDSKQNSRRAESSASFGEPSA